jgi:small subunit ribosomal protein S20
MANSKRNRVGRGQMRSLIKQVREALQENDAERVRQLLPKAVSRIDKTAKRGIIHRNTARRYKSMLDRRARQLEAGA